MIVDNGNFFLEKKDNCSYFCYRCTTFIVGTTKQILCLVGCTTLEMLCASIMLDSAQQVMLDSASPRPTLPASPRPTLYSLAQHFLMLSPTRHIICIMAFQKNTLFFYKNIFYKNIEAQKSAKFKNILRICWGSVGFSQKKN